MENVGRKYMQHNIADKELIFFIYKELYKTEWGKKDQTPTRKWAKDTNRQFTKRYKNGP